MAWEMIETNELTEDLERVREQSVMEFFQMFFIKDQARIDLQAVVMLIGAAISYLVIRSNNIDLFGGMEIGADQGWKRIEQAIAAISSSLVKTI